MNARDWMSHLAAARKARRLTQADVAAATGIPTSALRSYELGINFPSFRRFCRWCCVLGVEAEPRSTGLGGEAQR